MRREDAYALKNFCGAPLTAGDHMNYTQALPEPGYFHYRKPTKPVDAGPTFHPLHESYQIEIRKLNDQHQDLSLTLNSWYDHWISYSVPALQKDSMSHLIFLFRTHFSSAEKIMLAHDYPDYTSHRSIHELLLQQLDSVQSLLASEHRQSWIDRLELGEYLHASLLSHLDEEDKKTVHFFRDNILFI